MLTTVTTNTAKWWILAGLYHRDWTICTSSQVKFHFQKQSDAECQVLIKLVDYFAVLNNILMNISSFTKLSTGFSLRGNANSILHYGQWSGILLERDNVNCILLKKGNANHILLKRGNVSCILLEAIQMLFHTAKRCVGVSLHLCKAVGYVSEQPMHWPQKTCQLL